MNVFLTGATGFVGSVLTAELIHAGHKVVGLSRDDDGDNRLHCAGADAVRGSLDDPKGLRTAAAKADAVIHCAYNNDLSQQSHTDEQERAAIKAFADALEGSKRPLLLTSVTGMGAAAPGTVAVETFYDPDTPNPRKVTEVAGDEALQRGVNVSVVRLAQVHNTLRQGFVSPLMAAAKEKRVSAYVGDGSQRWPAVHVIDAVRLFRLALQRHEPGSRYHAVDEEGISVHQIAEAIGKKLSIPVVSLSPGEAEQHFGWLALFAGMDMPASSVQTQQTVRWSPSGPGLLHDLEHATAM